MQEVLGYGRWAVGLASAGRSRSRPRKDRLNLQPPTPNLPYFNTRLARARLLGARASSRRPAAPDVR